MTRICPGCAAHNALDASFCNQCGATLPPAQSAALATTSLAMRHPILIAGLLMILVVVFLGTDWWLWRHRGRALDSTPVAGESAESELAVPPARAAPPHPSVQALCADRTNFFTRNYCMDRQCRKPENGRDPDCVKMLADEKERNNNRLSPG